MSDFRRHKMNCFVIPADEVTKIVNDPGRCAVARTATTARMDLESVRPQYAAVINVVLANN